MTVKIVGRPPLISRTQTQFPSLDAACSNWATGDFGFPTRGVMELYGRPESGKTSLSFAIAGRVRKSGKVVVVPLDTYDPDYVARILELAGFDGTLVMQATEDDKGKEYSHEDILQAAARQLRDDDCSVTILDNITQVKPLVEEEGDYESAYMGKRAQLVGKWSRDVTDAVRRANNDIPKLGIAINQIRKMMGTRIEGWATPGGDAIKEAAMVRIHLSRNYELSKSYEGSGMFVGNGEVEKLRFGGRGREFKFFLIPGLGPHPGLSALYDAFDMEIAERASVVKFKGRSLGQIGKLISAAQAGPVPALDDVTEAVYARYQIMFKALREDHEKRMNLMLNPSKKGKK